MIQVKRNSKEFKTVKEIMDDYEDHPRRMKTIKLYSLKSTNDLEKKILINDAENATVIYDLDYGSIMAYLRDRSKKLFRNEKETLYYFKDSSKSKYPEFPFELVGKAGRQLKAFF